MITAAFVKWRSMKDGGIFLISLFLVESMIFLLSH